MAIHTGIETEDASDLNLGENFRNETCLSNAEVAVILEKKKRESENSDKELSQ